MIAEFSIHPIGRGTSLSRYVRSALSELENAKGVRTMVTPMGTIMEAGNLMDILLGVQRSHEALFKEGAKRVSFTLRVDDRRDKPRRMEDKVTAVTSRA